MRQKIKIPILDIRKQIQPIRKELDRAVKKIIDQGNFVFGKEIGEFEQVAAKYCKAKYALGVSNGTDAISLSLIALGIKPGDKVICPAFTYFATAGAIAAMGAVPVFVDIDPLTYNISVFELEKTVQTAKTAFKAVIPVHLFGQCADMGSILAISKKYGISVVEDAAHAFGADFHGKKAGTFGDCAAVSFFPGKNLGAFGDAGMVLTDSKILAQKVSVLRNQGNKERYFHTMLGYNHRLDTLQAAVLSVKLKYLDSWNKKRQANADYLNRGLNGLPVNVPYVEKGNLHIYHQYVLGLKHDNTKIIDYLRAKGIDARVYYPLPLHLQKCFQYLGYKKGDFTQSEKAARQTVALPVYPDLTRSQLDHIISTIREYYHA